MGAVHRLRPAVPPRISLLRLLERPERHRYGARLHDPVGLHLDGAEDERRPLRHELQILIAWGLRWGRLRALPGAFRFWTSRQTPKLYRLDIYLGPFLDRNSMCPFHTISSTPNGDALNVG